MSTCEHCSMAGGQHTDACPMASVRVVRIEGNLTVGKAEPATPQKDFDAIMEDLEADLGPAEGEEVPVVDRDMQYLDAIADRSVTLRETDHGHEIQPPGALGDDDSLYRVHKGHLEETNPRSEWARLGGKMRAQKLSPERQSEIGRKAHAARKKQ